MEQINQELWDGRTMSLSSEPKRRELQEKLLAGETLSILDGMTIGARDDRYLIRECDGYEFKPDHVYRVVHRSVYDSYVSSGYITRDIEEFEEGKNNGGVDWYLGGASLRYGLDDKIILEAPCDKRYFVPSSDNGCGMVSDPRIRHMKSSSSLNPVPMSMVSRVFDLKRIREKQESDEIYQNFLNARNKCGNINEEMRKERLVGNNITYGVGGRIK